MKNAIKILSGFIGGYFALQGVEYLQSGVAGIFMFLLSILSMYFVMILAGSHIELQKKIFELENLIQSQNNKEPN